MRRTSGPLRLLVVGLLALAGLGLVGGVVAQTPEPTPTPPPDVATLHTETALRAGPGDTYDRLGTLPAGLELTIVERNRVGNWVRVIGGGTADEPAINGWIQTGYLNVSPSLRFSELTVNETLPDADLSNVESEVLARLYAAPVIPTVSPRMQLIYARGRVLGNESAVVTKVGDSVTADPLYLSLMADERTILGPYDYLEHTIDFFGPRIDDFSVAARMGLTSFAVLDPTFADPQLCEPNETPLSCEFRLRKPSIAFIMLGPNDVHYMDVEEFDTSMRMLVDETLQAGVIPVLSTFTYDPNAPLWDEAIDFNLALVDIAADYEVPLINLWAAARALPAYGLDGDPVHMRHSGWRYLKFDTGHEAWFGVSLRNLLSVRMLDELRRTLNMR